MTPFLQFILILAIILFSAKLAGYLSVRLGQPSVLGELIAGVLLGPSLMDITHLGFITDSHLGETIIELGEIGVLFLMFLAGLELHINDLVKNYKVSALSGTLGVVVPVGLGWAAGMLLGLETDQAIFLGLTMGATSVSISVQTLMEMNVLRSKVGMGLLGAAVFDDVLVILLVSIFLAIESATGGFLQILLVLGKMILFLGLSVAFGIWVLPQLTRSVKTLPISQGSLTLALVITLIYGLSAELIGGMAAITGAFIAGLMFARVPEASTMENGFKALSYSLFVPVFFISIGLSIDLGTVGVSALWITIIISVLAVLGKIVGSGIGAYFSNYSPKESLQLGIGMVSRGEVGLIVALVGVNQGLLSDSNYSAIIGMVLITTLLTPLMLRASFKTETKSEALNRESV